MHGGHLGHVTLVFRYALVPLSCRCLLLNFALIGHAVTEEKMFEYYGNVYVYLLEMGTDDPQEYIFQNHK